MWPLGGRLAGKVPAGHVPNYLYVRPYMSFDLYYWRFPCSGEIDKALGEIGDGKVIDDIYMISQSEILSAFQAKEIPVKVDQWGIHGPYFTLGSMKLLEKYPYLYFRIAWKIPKADQIIIDKIDEACFQVLKCNLYNPQNQIGKQIYLYEDYGLTSQ